MNNRRGVNDMRTIQLEAPDMLNGTSVASCSSDMIGRVVVSNANDNHGPIEPRILQELTEREAAAELRVSVDTLQRERADGKIGYVQRRRRVLYPLFCIDAYRLSQVVTTCPTSGSIVKALQETGTSSGAKDAERNAAQWARRIKS